MKIEIYRWIGETYTIGKLFFNEVFFCNTLEPKVRDKNHDGDLYDQGEQKILKHTAIPCGHYKLGLNYSFKYKKPMPLIYDIKGFTGVLIHPGNTLNDTAGCILIGENTIKGQLTNSCAIFKTFMEKIKPYLINSQRKYIDLYIYDQPYKTAKAA